jgi:hypothetical protein
VREVAEGLFVEDLLEHLRPQTDAVHVEHDFEAVLEAGAGVLGVEEEGVVD